MIDLKELRLGNIVYIKNIMSGELIVESFAPWGEYLDYEAYGEPIPLTPEILIGACGFKHGKIKGIARLDYEIDPEDKKKFTYYWDLRIPQNDQLDDLSTFTIVQFGKGSPILWKYQMLSVKLTSLHQLQNLYYALTGEELKIDITKLKTKIPSK